MAGIRVNWNQESISSDHLIRAHQIRQPQHARCRFTEMNPAEYSDYPTVAAAEQAMRNGIRTSYKRCIHCWDNQVAPL